MRLFFLSKRGWVALSIAAFLGSSVGIPAAAQRPTSSRGANYARDLMRSSGSPGARNRGGGSNSPGGSRSPGRNVAPPPRSGGRPDGNGYRGDRGRSPRPGYRGGPRNYRGSNFGVYIGPGYGGLGYGGLGYGGLGYGGLGYRGYGYPGYGTFGYGGLGYGDLGYGYSSRSRVYVVPRYVPVPATPYPTQPYATQTTPRYLNPPTATYSQPLPQPPSMEQAVAIIETNSGAAPYQAEAERALRADQLEAAVRNARHAVIEDPSNGRLKLFAAQTLFAVGEYARAIEHVRSGIDQLSVDDWGYVVANFQQFYVGKAYPQQMERLVQQTKTNPNDADARLLRGYHYVYLGYEASAQRELSAALELRPDDSLAMRLLAVNGGDGEIAEGVDERGRQAADVEGSDTDEASTELGEQPPRTDEELESELIETPELLPPKQQGELPPPLPTPEG